MYTYAFVEMTYCGGVYAISDNSSIAQATESNARTLVDRPRFAVNIVIMFRRQPTECFCFGTSYQVVKYYVNGSVYCASTTSLRSYDSTWILRL